MIEEKMLTERDKKNEEIGDYSIPQLRIMIKNARGLTVTESDRQSCNDKGNGHGRSIREYFKEFYP